MKCKDFESMIHELASGVKVEADNEAIDPNRCLA